MKLNKVNGVDPYAFTPTDPDHDLTPKENEQIHKKVFVERRNDRNREKPLKPLKAVRRRAASSSNVELPPSTSRRARRRNATVGGSGPSPIVDEIQGIIDILGVSHPADEENPGAAKRHKRGGPK